MGERRGAAVHLVIAAAWTLAIVALLGMLVACGIMLARRVIRLLGAVGDLFAAPAILDGVHRAETETRPLPSVLEPVAEARERRDGFRQLRAERTVARRVARLERARDLIAPWHTR